MSKSVFGWVQLYSGSGEPVKAYNGDLTLRKNKPISAGTFKRAVLSIIDDGTSLEAEKEEELECEMCGATEDDLEEAIVCSKCSDALERLNKKPPPSLPSFDVWEPEIGDLVKVVNYDSALWNGALLRIDEVRPDMACGKVVGPEGQAFLGKSAGFDFEHLQLTSQKDDNPNKEKKWSVLASMGQTSFLLPQEVDRDYPITLLLNGIEYEEGKDWRIGNKFGRAVFWEKDLILDTNDVVTIKYTPLA